MSKDQYLEMWEQTGEEIDWERCPPDLEDFPSVVVDFLNIYYSLGNRVYPDIGYVGKDFTNLNLLSALADLIIWLPILPRHPVTAKLIFFIK